MALGRGFLTPLVACSRRLAISLALVALVVSASLLTSGGAAAAPAGTAAGVLAGNVGGSYAVYAIAYPGDGSPVEVTLEVATADLGLIRGTGANVYGPTAGKLYATTPDAGARRTISFSSTEPGRYVVQVYNYTPDAVAYTLTASHPLLRGKSVVLDPGHGGPEIGAVTASGDRLEKQVNLRIALKVAALLDGAGYQVRLTRDTDRPVSPGYRGGLSGDLQARVDLANAAGADLFISIHNNGGPTSESGTEVWYNAARPFSDRNLALARLVQANLLREIRGLGYPARDRGVKSDARFRVVGGRTYNLFVLGPWTPLQARTPTQMPGVLGESLFLTNAADAAMLRQERTLDAIARGYRAAIDAYFAAYPN